MEIMKNIMKNAWEIARKGQKQFGGKVSEYLSEAMKIAWKEARAPKAVEVETDYGSRKNKSWVAKINGNDNQWGFNREFLKASGEHDNGFGGLVFTLVDGLYEICDGGDREFAVVENGNLNYVDADEIQGMVA